MQIGVLTASNYQWQDTTHERHSHPFYCMPKIMCMLSALLLLYSLPQFGNFSSFSKLSIPSTVCIKKGFSA